MIPVNPDAVKRHRLRLAAVPALLLALGGGVMLANAAEPTTTTVSVHAFVDTNTDGVWNDGEQPATGVVFTLTPKSGGAGTDLTTDGAGESVLTLASGDYSWVITPDGVKDYAAITGTFGSSTAGDYALVDGADQDVLIGVSETVDCVADPDSCATVSGQAFYDADADGVVDAEEDMAEGVVVTLQLAGATFATATSDIGGVYSFVAPAGTYTIKATAPDGLTLVSGPADKTTGVTGEIVLVAHFTTSVDPIGLSVPVAPDPDPDPSDTTPPVLTVIDLPPVETTETEATFTVESNEPNTTFEYALDGAAPVATEASFTVTGLAKGADHFIEIRGTDQAGNVSDPVSIDWHVRLPGTAGPVNIKAGDPVSLIGEGFAAGESVELRLRPGDRVLATVAARADGGTVFEVTLPADVTPGEYTLAMVGLTSGAQWMVPLTVPSSPTEVPSTDPTPPPTAGPTDTPSTNPVPVGSSKSGGTLAYTGFDAGESILISSVLVLAGIGVLMLVRRRRRHLTA